MKKILGIMTVSLILLYACKASPQTSCPDKTKAQTSLSKLINRDFTVERVQPLKEIKGLCEVVVKVGLRPIVVYTDPQVKNIVVGNVFNIDTKENLTQKTVESYMVVSKDILQKLETLTNITYGKGDKFVYYISDPDCPFCIRLSPMLKEWADKNNVQIKVILYPLPIHPEAKKKSISMVCDGKGYDDIHRKMSTKNQCEKGKKAIEENIRYLQSIGVSGTPTLIGMNGRYLVGVPQSLSELDRLVQTTSSPLPENKPEG